MVYDTSKDGKTGKKRERFEVKGKLIGVSVDSNKCEICDKEKGKFSWLRINLVTNYDKPGEETEYMNITAFSVSFDKMKELARADDLLKEHKKPLVELQCYVSEALAFDKDKKPIYEEIEEDRDGKKVFVQRQKKYINYRMSRDDLINTFKVLDEDIRTDGEKSSGIKDRVTNEESIL